MGNQSGTYCGIIKVSTVRPPSIMHLFFENLALGAKELDSLTKLELKLASFFWNGVGWLEGRGVEKVHTIVVCDQRLTPVCG